MAGPLGVERVVKLLAVARDALLTTNPICIAIEDGGELVSGKLVMQNGCWKEGDVTVLAPGGERKFHIGPFPVGPFISSLSVLNPLLVRLRVMMADANSMVRSAVQEALADLQSVVDILCTRSRLCDDDLEPDWRRSIQPVPVEGAYLSVFPFRDIIEVTYLEAAAATRGAAGLHLDVKTGDVVTIGGRAFEITFCATARMRQGWLSQALMWMEEASVALANIAPLLHSKAAM